VCCLRFAYPAQTVATGLPPAELSIDSGTIVTRVSPMLYGLMTEEINHSYDGGLYAELLQNRTFRASWEGVEHWDLLRHGDSQAAIEIDKDSGPSRALPYSLKLTEAAATQGGQVGVVNSGYWGIALKPHATYRGSFYAEAEDASVGPMRARLINDKTGVVLAEATVPLHGGGWSQYTYKVTTGAIPVSTQNHLELTVPHAGTLRLPLVSLMQPTFHDRPNGNRAYPLGLACESGDLSHDE